MRFNRIFLVLFILFAFTNLSAQDPEAEVSEPEVKIPENVVFLLGRAIDASINSEDKWMAAVIEAVMEFKLAAVDKFTLVSPDQVRKHVPDHQNLSRVPSENEYIDAARKLKADFAGIQKFEISPRDKSVFYYMEIYSVKTKRIHTTIERNFKLDRIGVELDEILGALLKEFNLTAPRELARFLKLPAVGEDYKNLKQLGECIISERFSKGSDSAKIAEEYRRVCEKDRSMLVGYYRAGVFFEAVGKNSDAAEALNFLFLSLPEYLPIYIPLCRNFRKAGRYEDAVRVAMLGEQRGVKKGELLSEKALAYDGMGRKDDAEGVYKQIISGDPDDPYALLFYARRSNDQGNGKQGMEYSSRLINNGVELGRAHIEYGRSLMLQSRNEEAVKAFTTAKSHLGSDPEPNIYLGDLHTSLGKSSDALRYYEDAIKKAPDNVDLFLKAASAAEKAGDSKKALSILRQIESRYSNHGGLQRELGVLSLANKDTVKAKMHLEASVRAKTEDHRVLMGLGWIYLNSGELDKSFANFTRALPLVKDKSQCKLGLSMVYIKRGETASALSLLQEVSAADLVAPGINKLLGDAFFAKGEKQKALQYFKKERTISKPDSALQSAIASISFELSSAAEAKTEYQNLVKMGAGGAGALYRLTVLSLRLKDKASAQSYFSKAQKAGSADAETYFLIGKEYAAAGALHDAITAYELCVKKDPSREDAWVEYAGALTKSGKDSAAAEALMRLYAINNEKYKNKLAEAGQLFLKSGQKTKAKSAFTTFLDRKYVNPDVSLQLAGLEFEQKNYNAVISLLGGLSAAKINEKEAWMLAQSLCSTNQHAKAITHLKYLLNKNPRNLQAIELAAEVYEKTNSPTDALAMYKKYITLAGNHKEYSYRLAELYEKNNMSKEAVAQYEINIKSFKDDYRNYDRLGRLYVTLGQWKNAVRVIERALSFSEASSDLQGMLAKSQLKLGEKGAATENYRIYLEKAPKDSTTWLELGNLYFEQKKYSEAAKTLEKASAMTGDNFEVLKKTGIAYSRAGDLASAAGPLVKARGLNNKDIEVIELLAKCYRETKASKNLSDLLSQWAQLDLRNLPIRLELADLLMAESKSADAAKVLEEAAKLKSCDTDIHLKLAGIYEKLGSNEKWFAQLRTAAGCSPKNAELQFQIGRYFYQQKDYSKAQDYLLKAVSLKSSHIEANYMLGTCLTMQKKYKESVPYYNRAVNGEPSNEEYRLVLADAYYRSKAFSNALKIIRPLVLKDAAKPEALKLAGLLYKAVGKPDTAKQILEGVVVANKSCSECFAALGEIYYDEMNYRDASKHLQTAVNGMEYDEVISVKLAQSYYRQGKNDQARQVYETIFNKNPRNGEAFYRLCSIHLKNKNLVGAKEILARNTSNKHGWYYLAEGEISEAEGNLKAAAVSFGKALKMMPEAPEVQNACGRISLARRKYADAIMYFGRAMAGDPDNVQLILDLGKAYEGTQDYPSAMDLYQEVVRRQPDHPEVHYCMARITSKSKDHAKAVEMLKEGIRQNKKNGPLYMALGHEYRMMKQDDDALEAYLKAAKTDNEQSKEAYRHIGNIYYTKRDEKKAKKFYEMYINEGGTNAKVKAILKKLQ